MPNKTSVRWGNTVGLMGDTYRDMVVMSGIVMVVALQTVSLQSDIIKSFERRNYLIGLEAWSRKSMNH